jgi:hypothetical protein
MNEAIDRICEALGVTAEQLAADIHAFASWVEEGGNKGVLMYEIEQRNQRDDKLPIYFLDEAKCREALDGIMFYAEPKRKSDYSGWYVRKKPHWKSVWAERFALENELGQKVRAELEAARLAEEERNRVKRKEEWFSQGRFEDFDTFAIAYRAAVAAVMYRRHSDGYWSYDNNAFGYSTESDNSVSKYMAATWQREHNRMMNELEYRTKAAPEQRTSKKKTLAAVEDFAAAAKFIEAGTEYFFSLDYIRQCLSSEAEPDLRIDPEHLPRQPLDKEPVRRLTDSQVVRQFMKFVADNTDENSFEYQDIQLIIGELRKKYARARGQSPDGAPIDIKREES